MKMIKIYLLVACAMCSSGLFSQKIIQQVAIKYERKINLAKLYPKWDWVQKKEYRFSIDSFELKTNGIESTYTKLENDEPQGWGNSINIYSNIYIHQSKGIFVSKKEIADGTFLVNDSLRPLKWKLSSESRDILGYKCYKAETKLLDSFVIVAFYCPEITPSSGPESMYGLPGTILGLVIPNVQTTYIARKITPISKDEKLKFIIPDKGKPTNLSDLEKKLLELFKNDEVKYRTIFLLKSLI